MASLSNIISAKLTSTGFEEENLEKGEIFVYTPNMYNHGPAGYSERTVWKSPGAGKAVIEVWGAGGSSGKQCCCGAGIPGNPGAYVKKTINVDGDTWIRGVPGLACANDTLCFKGCSESSCYTICSPNGGLAGLGSANCICLCAQGGTGGMTFCSGSSQNSCCYSANGYCTKTVTNSAGAGCFMVCNIGGPVYSPKCAYGGDINCHSGTLGGCNFSCASFGTCYDYKCGGQYDHVAYPPGIITDTGGVVTYQRECYSNSYDGVGDGLSQLIGALSFAGRNSSIGGSQYANCWSSGRQCGCYEFSHCVPNLPFGVPSPGSSPEANVRDYGSRGGAGAIRIKFIAS